MKIKLFVISILITLALILFHRSSFGADSMLQPLFNADKWNAGAGYAHSISGGGRSVAFAEASYNFSTNVSAIAGGDYLFTQHHHQAEVLKGGLSLKTQVYPLVFTGSKTLAAVRANPWAADLLCTPKGGGNNVGNLALVGLDVDLFSFDSGQYWVSLDGFYENRSGQGYWDGQYAGVFLALSRNKYSLSIGIGQPPTSLGGSSGEEMAMRGPQARLTWRF
jgi:hypothetical protein